MPFLTSIIYLAAIILQYSLPNNRRLSFIFAGLPTGVLTPLSFALAALS